MNSPHEHSVRMDGWDNYVSAILSDTLKSSNPPVVHVRQDLKDLPIPNGAPPIDLGFLAAKLEEGRMLQMFGCPCGPNCTCVNCQCSNGNSSSCCASGTHD